MQAQKHSSLELDLDVLKLLDPAQELDPELCAQDLVDFSPVYRCLHIHSVLVCGRLSMRASQGFFQLVFRGWVRGKFLEDFLPPLGNPPQYHQGHPPAKSKTSPTA